MELTKGTLEYLEELLKRTETSFEGLSARWDELQPRKEFGVKISEDFHLGFVFGKIEDDFVGHFYTECGRAMTDSEYKQFWWRCREFVRDLHKRYDMFYFQE